MTTLTSRKLKAVPLLAFALLSAGGAFAADASISGTYKGVRTADRFSISSPLATVAASGTSPRVVVEREANDDRPSGQEGPLGPQETDLQVQMRVGVGTDMPSASVSFDGLTNTLGVYPPDPNGAVGPNHYVQMVNSTFGVFNKSGVMLLGPYNTNVLWAGLGGPCETENAGDPIVLYDQLADRWLLSQFTAAGPTYYNCIALSTGPDPTGTYYRWAFSTGTQFPDYPKLAVWPDAYYLANREFAGGASFSGVGAYALNRAQMLVGNASPQVISFSTGTSPSYAMGDGLLPVSVDGTALPPAGSPAYFIGSRDNGGPYGAPTDALNIWTFFADFATPSNSTFALTNVVATAAFDSMLSTCSSRNCIPQPGTAQKLDHQGYRQRLLHRAAYRNFGTHESIVTNQSVEAAAGLSGIRWWEIRSPRSAPFIYQEGTYAPGITDGIHRWMGSIAQDRNGAMGLGFSVSDATSTYPGVRFTGRLASDPVGLMSQGEGILVNGGGSQTGTAARWGDYSAMSVDPVDDCTFWYTTEYYATTSATGWRTRIGAFKFPSCGPTYPITTAVSPVAGGSVSCSPNPVSSGGTATCTATPSSGYGFSSWGGHCSGTSPTCQLTNVTSSKNVTANFVLMVAPGAPTITSVQVLPGAATFFLSAPANTGGGPIVQYAVTCSAAGQPTRSATSTSLQVTVTGLKGGVVYSCSATASNSSYTSPSSTTSTVSILKSASNIVPVLMLLLD